MLAYLLVEFWLIGRFVSALAVRYLQCFDVVSPDWKSRVNILFKGNCFHENQSPYNYVGILAKYYYSRIKSLNQ